MMLFTYMVRIGAWLWAYRGKVALNAFRKKKETYVWWEWIYSLCRPTNETELRTGEKGHVMWLENANLIPTVPAYVLNCYIWDMNDGCDARHVKGFMQIFCMQEEE